MSKLWMHVPILSSAVYFDFVLLLLFFRVLKGLQDSRVKRYVCPKVSLLGVMVLRFPEPDLTLFTLKGDPGVGVQGSPGPTGPPGLKVSCRPILIGGSNGQGFPGGRRKRAFYFLRSNWL